MIRRGVRKIATMPQTGKPPAVASPARHFPYDRSLRHPRRARGGKKTTFSPGVRLPRNYLLLKRVAHMAEILRGEIGRKCNVCICFLVIREAWFPYGRDKDVVFAGQSWEMTFRSFTMKTIRSIMAMLAVLAVAGTAMGQGGRELWRRRGRQRRAGLRRARMRSGSRLLRKLPGPLGPPLGRLLRPPRRLRTGSLWLRRWLWLRHPFRQRPGFLLRVLLPAPRGLLRRGLRLALRRSLPRSAARL